MAKAGMCGSPPTVKVTTNSDRDKKKKEGGKNA